MRKIICFLLPVALLAGGHSSNRWYLFGHDKRKALIEKSISPEEGAWLGSVFEATKRDIPAQIGDWRLNGCSYEFNPKSDSPWIKDVSGARLRFLYSNKSGKKIIIYHFINPVRLSYPEVGWGYYLGFSTYHHKEEEVPNELGWKIFTASGWLPLNSPMIADSDRADVNAKGMARFCCYRGVGWSTTSKTSASDPTTVFVDMGLPFREQGWNKQVYGELCILALPEAVQSSNFVMSYLKGINR
jgi:hypothetical protein